MTQVNNVTSSASIGSANLGPTQSLQLMFAKLQLELAETAKTQAMDRMKGIQQCQEEQKLVAQLLNEARQAKSDCKEKTTAEIRTTYADGRTETIGKGSNLRPMSPEMVAYMDKHGLAYDKAGGDHKHDEKEWDVAIASLQSRLEQLGTNTQQEMVYIQDYMGQYNSYIQGANTQISQSNQVLQSLARGQ